MSYRIQPLDRGGIQLHLSALRRVAKRGHRPDDDFVTPARMLAVFDGAELVAYGAYACYHGHWTLRNCVVAPAHRGRGLQRLLIRERLKQIRAAGAKRVSVWVDPANAHSIRNLEACGFKLQPDKPKSFCEGGALHCRYVADL